MGDVNRQDLLTSSQLEAPSLSGQLVQLLPLQMAHATALVAAAADGSYGI